jgi:hypothetical protein
MEPNDSATVSAETTEETGAEPTETKESSNDLSEIKTMLEQFNSDLGSLKRTVKGLSKKPERSETPEKTAADSSVLLEKAFLRTAGITDKEEVDLAISTAEKWGLTIDQLVDDDDFKTKLDRHRISKANATATSNVKGDKVRTVAKDSVEYWLAKGVPPTPDQLPNRARRAEIIRAFAKTSKGSGKTFYND